MTAPDRVPQPLVDAILRGRCIAFVGAGVSSPAVPGWKELLVGIGARLGVTVELPDRREIPSSPEPLRAGHPNLALGESSTLTVHVLVPREHLQRLWRSVNWSLVTPRLLHRRARWA